MPRLRFRAPAPPSRLELKFTLLWRTLDGPELEREFRFHPERNCRADVAHLESRTLLEIEGGLYIQGRHCRAAGLIADSEKYLEAFLAGWSVVRLVAAHRYTDRGAPHRNRWSPESKVDVKSGRHFTHKTA